MLYALKLMLPAVIPSWNFFDVIVPSPRIQFRLLDKNIPTSDMWQEYRPRVKRITFKQMLIRMVWNAQWNESLFLLSCAERLMDYPTKHSEEEIFKRLTHEIRSVDVECEKKFLQFRLVFIQRKGSELEEQIRYQSEPRLIEK